MKRSQGRSWFAALRRDGRLFAIAAALSLVFAMLQPLVPAQAAADAAVICSAHADAATPGKGVPADPHDCPCCIFGHICGGLPLHAKALAAGAPAFAPSSTFRHVLANLRAQPAGQRIAAGPPGIRAPPSV
jgi:hypothetical protein